MSQRKGGIPDKLCQATALLPASIYGTHEAGRRSWETLKGAGMKTGVKQTSLWPTLLTHAGRRRHQVDA